MKIKLKDGKTVEMVPLSRKITVRMLLNYINDLTDENLYLSHDKKYTYKQEKEWFENTLKNMKKGIHIHHIVLCNRRIIGSATASQGTGRERNNVGLGVAISKEFRRVGLGEKLLKFIIKKAKKKWKPKNIFLSVASENKPAYNLYKKIGFKEFSRFPKWIKYKNRYVDQIFLLYKN